MKGYNRKSESNAFSNKALPLYRDDEEINYRINSDKLCLNVNTESAPEHGVTKIIVITRYRMNNQQ